jgi:chromosomal replication initiation ATPase DnaA
MKKAQLLNFLINHIAKQFNVSVDDIKGGCRQKNIVLAKQIFCYLATKKLKSRLLTTGKYLNKNHATILYASNKINDEISIYKDTLELVVSIEKSFNEIIPIEIDLLKKLKK